jgi:hypothetical protein
MHYSVVQGWRGDGENKSPDLTQPDSKERALSIPLSASNLHHFRLIVFLDRALSDSFKGFTPYYTQSVGTKNSPYRPFFALTRLPIIVCHNNSFIALSFPSNTGYNLVAPVPPANWDFHFRAIHRPRPQRAWHSRQVPKRDRRVDTSRLVTAGFQDLHDKRQLVQSCSGILVYIVRFLKLSQRTRWSWRRNQLNNDRNNATCIYKVLQPERFYKACLEHIFQ